LNEKEEMNDAFFENYKFLSKTKENTSLSSVEILSKILQLDNGVEIIVMDFIFVIFHILYNYLIYYVIDVKLIVQCFYL